ncbi:MAG TPA: excinuclease ABC subunit UvrC, partial [Dehalococcoidia bacterium]|nr:excinuclease ABC subunit UvrC [Dehalococcoidia bacterium]
MATSLAAKLQDQVQALPGRPGVYLFRNSEGQVVYVGKAASLRTRVRNYFGSPRSLEPKTRNLVAQIADIDYILTSTVQEALILEATLVKRHQPFFNVRLKDDKHYPYLKIDLNEEWPRVEITRRVLDDGARYFGPYASAGSVRRSLDLVKKLFPWRSCTKVITGNDPRPCLDYYIHRCIGPCASLCSKEEYDEVIRQVVLFLEGRSEEIVSDLKRQMEQAAEDMEFERAARLRDQVRAIERTTERQVMEVRERIDMDVFGLA